MKYFIFELFSGVGFVNQLFSLESAIYLSNITNRKLILLIKNPLCHIGRVNWSYGKFMELFADDYLKYLPNGIDIYYSKIPEDIIKMCENAIHFTKKSFNNSVFIDKELNILNNKTDINNFCGGRELVEIDYNKLNDFEHLYIQNDTSNASRCLYNFYTTKNNMTIMNKICYSLSVHNIKIKEKISLIDNNIKFNYNAVHFRFGDHNKTEQEINTNNDMFLNKFNEVFENNNDDPIFIMCDRKDNKILDILKKKYNIIFVDDFISSISGCKFPDENPVENFLLERYICEKADIFIGTIGSTVSNYIQYMRCLNNKTHNINFQKTLVNKTLDKYEWNDNYISSHPISWSYFFNVNIIKDNSNSFLQIIKRFNINPIKNKKIISFSIYGIGDDYENKRGFYKGIFVNYEIAKNIYPGWIIRIYLPYNEPKEYLDKLIRMKDIEVILIDTNICLRALRFLPNDDTDVDLWISRDLDSIVDYREKAAVDDWLVNYPDKELHIMTDNSQHTWTIAGGMFGVKNNHNKLIDFMLNFSVQNQNNYAIDCLIAENFFYKNDNYIQHYSSGKKLEKSIKFPSHNPNKYCNFVGDIVNINKYYQELEIENKYNNNSYTYILQNKDVFSYKPWNTDCILEWYNETDFILTPIKTNTSTSMNNSSFKTINGDGKKMMDIGTRLNVLWDGCRFLEAFLDEEYNINIDHGKEGIHKFIKII